MERTVFVTNKSKAPLTDKCGGKEYAFPLGKTVEIPAVVATHIFGFEMDDKTSRVARLGWGATAKDMEKALARLAQFEIAPGKQAEDTESLVEHAYVMNKNPQGFIAVIAGEKYEFKPRAVVDMPKEHAQGVFGIGLSDPAMSTVYDRLSQQNPSVKVDAAFLAAVEISEEPPQAKAA